MGSSAVAKASASFCAAADGEGANAAATALASVLENLRMGGKENAAGKQHKATALKSLKAAQQKFGRPGNDAAVLAAVCASALRVVENGTGASSTSQLQAARYNAVRGMVSARAFSQAFQEALVLYGQLKMQHGSGKVPPGLAAPGEGVAVSVEAVNLVVGTVLTLVLCWAEEPGNTAAKLDLVLEAVDSAEDWLRLLALEDASKHRNALFTYLYRGAVKVAGQHNWAAAQVACCSMLCVDAPRALGAAAKIAACAPTMHAVSLLTAVVDSRAVHSSLAALAAGSLAASAEAQLPQHVAVLAAVLQPANALRRVVAPLASAEGLAAGELLLSLDGATPAAAAAAALDVLAAVVRTGAKAAPAADGEFSTFGHAAAVAVVTAQRLRAALTQQGQAEGPSQLAGGNQGWERLLDFSWPVWRPAGSALLSLHELSWLSSSSFNTGVDLHTSGHHLAATGPFRCAVAAALAAACCDNAQGSAQMQRLHDVSKRALALVEALQEAGSVADAVQALADVISLLIQAGFTQPQHWQHLVAAFVRLPSVETRAAAASASSAKASGASRRGTSKAAPRKADKKAGAHSLEHSWLHDRVFPAAELLCGEDHDKGVQKVAHAQLEALVAVAQEQDAAAATSAQHDAAALAVHLLDSVYPAAQRPVQHVRTLLYQHSLHLPHILEGLPSREGLLGRAAAALERHAPATDAEAGCLAAQIAVLQALEAAHAVVEAALEAEKERQAEELVQRQQQAPAAAADAAAGGGAGGEGEAASTPQESAAAWEHVRQQAQQAVEQCTTFHGTVRQHQAEGSVQVEAFGGLAASARELACMLGLQGHFDLERQLAAAAASLASDEAAAALPVSGALHCCLFPESGDTDAATDAAALEAEAAALATTAERSLTTTLQRAALCVRAALQHSAGGDTMRALHAASEAHRLLSNAVHAGVGTSPALPSSASSSGAGWWALAAAYLGGLLLLGELFEAAGLADEAVQAYKEGGRLAAISGSLPLAALFRARLADVWLKQGEGAACRDALEAVACQVASVPPAVAESSVLRCCEAQAACTQACLHLSEGSITQAVLSCHEAAEAAEQLAGASACPAVAARAAALQAAAALARAECLAAEGRGQEAAEQAATALQQGSDQVGSVAGTACKARLLLFLAELEAAQPEVLPLKQPAVWGVQIAAAASPQPALDTPVAAKKAAAGRSKAPRLTAAPAGGGAAAGEGWGSDSGSWRLLWEAYLLSRGMPHLHRVAAAQLAPACGAAGRLHLAALLLHISCGPTMQLQHRLVLHARHVQAQQAQQRQGSGAGSEAAAAERSAAEALHTLDCGLDEALIALLAGTAQRLPHQPSQRGVQRARRAAPAADSPTEQRDALAALDAQAQHTLQGWLRCLPPGTPVCTLTAHPLAISASTAPRLAAAYQDRIVLSRLQLGTFPLVVDLPVQALGAGLLPQHPIRALSMDVDAPPSGDSAGAGAVASAVREMERVLEDSARSMKEMRTDTKEQQREWWRARVGLDDSLAGLVQHLHSSWLGAWRCLLAGPPEGAQEQQQLHSHAERAVAHLQEQLDLRQSCGKSDELEGGGSAERGVELAVQLAAAVLHARVGLSLAEMQQAAALICCVLGVNAAHGAVAAAVGILRSRQLATAAPTAAADLEAGEASARAAPARRVKFQDPEPLPAPKADGMAAEFSPPPVLRRAAAAAAPPLEPRSALAGNLCSAFDALAVAEGATAAAQVPASTVRAKKHRSRLGLMQAATPAPKSARKPLAATLFEDPAPATATRRTLAATAPRAPRPPAATPAASTVPVPSRPPAATPAPAGGPVVVVLDPLLQALPWESVPGLAGQKLYRLPSLACAAAAHCRRTHLQGAGLGPGGGCLSSRIPAVTSRNDRNKNDEAAPAGCSEGGAAAVVAVDVSSAFYALNPSGDLASTQAAFEPWFRGLAGWEGRVGGAPSPTELAAALQARELFVYFGHGGGEQYLPPSRLRALPCCASALLMGCSSGRLRGRRLYEPSGAVLAYLLAGCPAAVANLWDVTDKDIDRFSQAVLTRWLAAGGGGGDFSAVVAQARAACKLPHLIGAAPVCYGVPAAATQPPAAG